jgi:hypothetical protein
MCYGPEFVAAALRKWIAAVGAKTTYIESGSPWENGYVASFIGKLRDELLTGELFYTLAEAKIVIQQWRRCYNTITLDCRAPAPKSISWPVSSDSLPVARPAGTPPLVEISPLN